MTLSTAYPPSRLVSFVRSGDIWHGYLQISHAQLGVLYQEKSVPELYVEPPVRVPNGQADDFLTAVAKLRQSTEESMWGLVACDPDTGEVMMRLSPLSADCIDEELSRAAAFLDAWYPTLAQICLPKNI